MNPPLLTIRADFLSSITLSTPDRVRRRLDQTPDAASEWKWQHDGQHVWIVAAGEETVTLNGEQICSIEQVSCSCLLSPNCFHVLACLTTLSLATDTVEQREEVETLSSHHKDLEADLVDVTVQQQNATREVVSQVMRVLNTGVAQSGVLAQAGLIRAVHQCRAEGLHRLASIGLRAVTGIREQRSHAPQAEAAELAIDLTDLLETSHHMLHDRPVASIWLGSARRKQTAIRARKLYGLFAEPIKTRSGFTGAAVYLLGDDGLIYSASDVRPGDEQRIRDMYLGGIEIGSMTQPAKKMARTQYLGSELTASTGGRLGRGKDIQIVDHGISDWHSETIQHQFRRSWQDQRNRVYGSANLAIDLRPAGWDFVFLQGRILGAVGAELILQVEQPESGARCSTRSGLVTGASAADETDPAPQQPTTTSHPRFIRLAIENDHRALLYRENLRLLSHAPGLEIQLIGRLHLQDPQVVSPLVVAPASSVRPSDSDPRFDLPSSFGNRVCLGFDELERSFLINSQVSARILSERPLPNFSEDPLSPLRRVWLASMLMGHASLWTGTTRRIVAEAAELQRTGYATAAALLDALTSAQSATGPAFIDTFLATGVYLRTCELEFARVQADQSGAGSDVSDCHSCRSEA